MKAELEQITDESRVFADEPMKAHTTFRVGGPADYFVDAANMDEIRDVIRLCREKKVPYYILGNGSNLLVGDKGYRGVVIQTYRAMNEVRVEGDVITAQAGALLSKIANAALGGALAGLEFAAGIPGTLGGAVVMNAGAYGGEMKDVLLEVTVLDGDGNVLVIPREKLELGYRTSIIAKKGYIVVEAKMQLRKGDRDAVKARMEELREQRVTKQPLEFASAGSTFKRPEGYFAGKLIQDAGLCGFRVGDAQVSEKHCGFVINRGNATAAEIVDLMNQVSEKVEEQFHVRLEAEVKRLGEF